jgi:hypothetical protein
VDAFALGGASASAARAMSRSLARDSEQMVDSRTAVAIALIDSKSPGEAAAKPASMTSTRKRSSCLAMRTFRRGSSRRPAIARRRAAWCRK